MAEENKLQVFPVGITEKEIKKIADEAIAEAGGSGGTEVIANPELSGTEADLTGLQVGDTKYKIAAGGSGGDNPYVVNIDSLDETSTMGDLIDKMGIDPSSLPQFNSGNIGWFLLVGEKSSPVISKGIARINWSTYGTTSFTLIIINDDGKTTYLSQQATALLSGLQVGNSQPFIPEFSSLDTTKKWTLVITTGQSYPHWEAVE